MNWIKVLVIFIFAVLIAGCGEFGTHLKTANNYLDEGKYTDADAEFDKALQIKSDNEKALRGKSITEAILSEQKRAKKAELKASATETELKLVKQTSNEEISGLNQKISKIKEGYSKKEAEFKKNKADMKSEISAKSKEIAKLKQDLAKVQTDITELKKSLADAKTELSNAQQELAKVSEIKADYEKKLKEVKEAPIAELKELKKENSKIRNEMDKIQGRILALKKSRQIRGASAVSSVEPVKEIDKIFQNAMDRLSKIEDEAVDIELKARSTKTK